MNLERIQRILGSYMTFDLLRCVFLQSFEKCLNLSKSDNILFDTKGAVLVKQRKLGTLALILALIMMLLLVACKGSGVTSPQDQSTESTQTPSNPVDNNPTPPLNVENDDSLQDMLQNAVAHIHEAGLSSGSVSLDGEMENDIGELIYLCSDDTYNYSIHSNGFRIIIAYLKYLTGLYMSELEADALGENEIVQKGHDLVVALFPYMDSPSLSIIPDFDFDGMGSARIVAEERRDDCFVNVGYIELSKTGIPLSFNATYNSFDDFKDSNRFSKEEIIELAFVELIEIKRLMEASGGFATDDTDGVIGLFPPGGDWFGFDFDGTGDNQAQQPPPFEMYLDAQSDVSYIRVEKEKTVSAGIVWVVEAQVKTSWGEYDSILDFIWCFKIDANTGERVGDIEAMSGAMPGA